MNNEQHKLLNAAALLFVGVALAVMLFQYIAAPRYSISNTQMLENVNDAGRWVMPHDLHAMLAGNRLDRFLLVDLRIREEFNRGTMPGAINIPFEQLLEKKSLRQLKTRKPIMVFSGKEAQASAAGMLLEAKGFKQVFVIANDFGFIKENVMEQFHPAAAFTSDEKARYDYSRFFKAAPKPAAAPAVTRPGIIETQVISVEGGC